MKDLRGNEIEIGSEVAYNRSGDVVHGFVECFGRPTRYYGPSIFVRNSSDNKLSKVKQRRSVLVIFEKRYHETFRKVRVSLIQAGDYDVEIPPTNQAAITGVR